MITKLSHSTFYVTDQEKARRFYVDKLGFELRMDMSTDGFRWLAVGPEGQQDMSIVLYLAAPGPMMDEETAGHLRALLEKGMMGPGVFDTDDCKATYDKMLAKGVEFSSPPQQQPYGIEAIFKDGCGNWFSLTQRTNG
jgi:catechol 2,3-dioxygenase-like lactoylglutathione lyase family enzyme